MIQDEISISTTDKILNKLQNILPKKKKYILQHYVNGRECGYSLSYKDRKVCWSEFRNTDQTVVYYGKMEEFISENNSINLPSEQVYKTKIFFDPNRVDEVVDFIMEFLK